MAHDGIFFATSSGKPVEFSLRSVTDGKLKTGVVYSDVSYYVFREGANAPAYSGDCVTASVGSYTDHGFVETGSGSKLYQFGLPAGSLAAGAQAVTVKIYAKTPGTVDFFEVVKRYLIVGDADTLITRGTGTGQLSVTSGKAAATIATGDITDIPAARAAYIDRCQYLPNTAAGGPNGLVINGTNTGTMTLGALSVTSGTTFGNTSIGTLTTTGLVTLAQFTLQNGYLPAPLNMSTLTQAQITGGAYSVQSASCVLGDARIANLDAKNSTLASAIAGIPAAATNAAAVWDLTTTGHTTAGTFGAAMSAAGSAGDPWITPLPGSYLDGTAGYILGNLSGGTTPVVVSGAASILRTTVASMETALANLAATLAAETLANVANPKASYTISTGEGSQSVDWNGYRTAITAQMDSLVKQIEATRKLINAYEPYIITTRGYVP